MTTQPSDWAVARAWNEVFDATDSETNAQYLRALWNIQKRARELDASGGGPDDDIAMHWIDRYAAGLDDVCQLDRIREALAPRAAEAYAKANPLGGPATMFETIARRLRAGENYDDVLADYGLARVAEAGGRDGERYRWLRQNLLWAKLYDGYVRWTVEILMPEPGIHEGHPPVAETLDAAIDAAMGAVGAGDAESAFKAWYWEHGANWNSASIKPVWMAAWSAVTSAVGTTRSGTEETEG